jgi:hypothetical protein
VVEADPSGGDLVARLASLDGDTGGLRDTPSTVQLAAASRAGLSDRQLLGHLQRLPGAGEIRVLVAPSSPFAASTAVAALVAGGIGSVLTGLVGLDILLDVGRVDAISPILPLLRYLGSITLVTRPTMPSVLHTRDLVASLQAAGIQSSLIVIGERPYPPSEVVEAIGTTALVNVLPDDPVGARALGGDARNAKVLGRTRLMRASAELATRIAPPLLSLPATPFNGTTAPVQVAP